jgi:hypothetical protein
MDNIPDVKEALNEYFKLKLKYETQIKENKKKIINNQALSNREKRSEYLKLKPKCINCKRPSGTIFKTTFFHENDKEDSHRQYGATCGIIANPCNLNIKINVGKVELLPNLLNLIQREIKESKDKIIDDKNKLLFGYLTTEQVLEKFEELKDNINLYTSLYEEYLENYNNIVDNDKKIEELNESITNSYIQIDQIKEYIKQMNDTDNYQFAIDIVNIYENTLIPLLNKIRNLKYNESFVWHNEDTNTCNLIQNKYSIHNLSYTSYNDKVISYNVGLEAFTNKNKKRIIIDSSESEEANESQEANETQEANKIVLNLSQTQEVTPDEPIYEKDGISWNKPEYNKLWDNLPQKLKNALTTDREWMNSFMFNCVKSRSKNESCKFISPIGLKLPPVDLPSGEYSFGFKIYDDVFNKLPKSTQQTYLTLYSVKDDVKDYSILSNAMNELVAKEIGFNRGYF